MLRQWQGEFITVPVAKGRPRVSGGHTFTPKKTRDFENFLKLVAKQLAPKELILGPIKVEIDFHLKKPKRPQNAWPCVRPDLDNYVKAVCDSLDGIVWKDDGQVCELIARKKYTLGSSKISVNVQQLPKPGAIV